MTINLWIDPLAIELQISKAQSRRLLHHQHVHYEEM